MKDARILLGVTGSIAACKAAELASRMVKDGAEVTVVMTDPAQRFVTPLTFETLSRRPVITGMWERAREIGPVHVTLAEWAELLVVAPASANFIGKLAHGIADDMLSTTAITVDCPVLIAPAMNVNMYRHPAVQANIRLLEQRGAKMIGPVEGRLASGAVAMGRMADVEEVLAAVRAEIETLRGT
jgi:phosphopantothenoylcysteine decarboxylase/phosphopantothenate--cysteine ligase